MESDSKIQNFRDVYKDMLRRVGESEGRGGAGFREHF